MRCPRNILMVLSALWCATLGAQLILSPPSAGFEHLEALLPFHIWGAIWIAAGLVAAVQAVLRRSPGILSFSLVVGLMAGWGGGQLSSWAVRYLYDISTRDHGWMSGTIFLLTAAILGIAASNIPHRTPEDEQELPRGAR